MTAPDNDTKDNERNTPNTTPSGLIATGSALTLDVDYFQSFLDDSDISDTKKCELIETLWSIVVGFVDLGFGIHPVQQADQSGAIKASNGFSKIIADIAADIAPSIDKEQLNTTNNNLNEDNSLERLDA